ncbi:lysoplasmalogenase [Clostridium sp. UBA4395]|uniref:lysoplasmalogenase n=1 Tax=Clostridium sp. UBA4395 TaxID=1946360 RepID=UPI003217D16F
MLSITFFIFMLISLGFLIYFNYHPHGYKMPIVKTITSLLFIAICVSSCKILYFNTQYFIFILFALITSLIGDVFLAFNTNEEDEVSKMFVYGLISFSIAHIFFSLAFATLTPVLIWHVLLFILISIISILFLNLIKGFDFKGAYKLVVTYSIIISFMVTRALSLTPLIHENFLSTILIIVGACLFFLSDLILCFIYFHKKSPSYMTALNLLCYYVGQGLIALSLAL